MHMRKMKKLNVCPVCGSELHVREYSCPRCGTVIRGDFEQCEFCKLDEEQMEFLRIFIRARGNLSEVAKIFGISHPTARARLSSIIAALGYEPLGAEKEVVDSLEILEMLERGEITAEEAEKLLKNR